MNFEVSVDKLLFNLSKKDCIEYKDIKLCIQDYLHYINLIKNSNDEKAVEKLFISEPQYYSNIPNNVYAYIAAIVEKLTEEFSLTVPEWIFKEKYYLENPWFPPEIEKFEKIKDTIQKVSPHQFKSRNLFVSAEAISIF